MPRHEITVYACAACLKKGESVPGTTEMKIGEHVWDLCPEHADRFITQFMELFGSEDKGEESAA